MVEKHGKQSHFQQEFLIMVTSMNSFTKELEKLGFLFYSICQLTKFSSNWQMGFRLISQNLEISMFC